MRLYREPPPIDVRPGRDGRPGWVRRQGRRERARVCNAWRVEGAWWAAPPDAGRRDDGREAGEAARSYYLLLTASGALLTVFETGGRWFLERVVD